MHIIVSLVWLINNYFLPTQKTIDKPQTENTKKIKFTKTKKKQKNQQLNNKISNKS